MSIGESQSKSKGTTIWVPVEFKNRVRSLSERYRKSQWRILLDALSLYEAQLRKPVVKAELSSVDKVIWYIEKLCMSIGVLKENPSENNVYKTLKTISQVRERLEVNTDILERAINDYVRLVHKKSEDAIEKHASIDEATMELNMALKSVLMDIMYKHILREQESASSEVR